MVKQLKICTIPGDGIGTEVISAGVEVLQALAKRAGSFQFKVDHFDWGGEYYKKHGRMMPENGRDQIRKHDAILFGSAGQGDGFGLVLLPLMAGVLLLFADRYRKAAWFLVWASLGIIFVGVLQGLLISFRPTTLWNLLTMLFLMASGGGLMFRSLTGYDGRSRGDG